MLRDLLGWVGGDGGFLQQITPYHAPPDEGTFHELDLGYIAKCFAGWDAQYVGELAPLVGAAAADGVVIDARVLDTRARARTAFYADVMCPQRVHESLMGFIGIGEQVFALWMMRRSARTRSFTDRSLSIARTLLPVIAVADSLIERVRPHVNADIAIPRLTRRESDVAALVALGYTNREIGLALGSSPFTVRNQLVGLFRKAQVTTRAELAAIIARHGD